MIMLIKNIIFLIYISSLFLLPMQCCWGKINKLTFPSSYPYVSDTIWQQISEFLLPDNHPAKKPLDKIFSTSRALCNMETMVAAGFEKTVPQHHTHLIVTRHPDLKGYIIKTYLDEQEYHLDQPEYVFWIMRATGARLTREIIIKHHFEDYFKVPHKWIYLIPNDPSPPPHLLRKNFLLIEEDMNIMDNEENIKNWGSKKVTKKLLDAFFVVLTEAGLRDCAKPSNAPFCVDGKIAIVDTQSYNFEVKYWKLLSYLSPKAKKYWRKHCKK